MKPLAALVVVPSLLVATCGALSAQSLTSKPDGEVFEGHVLRARTGGTREIPTGMTSTRSSSRNGQLSLSGSRTRSRVLSIDQSGNRQSSSLTPSCLSEWPSTPERIVTAPPSLPKSLPSDHSRPRPRSAARQARGTSPDSHDRKPYPALITHSHTKHHKGFRKALKPTKVIKKRPIVRVNDQYRAKFKKLLSSVLNSGPERLRAHESTHRRAIDDEDKESMNAGSPFARSASDDDHIDAKSQLLHLSAHDSTPSSDKVPARSQVSDGSASFVGLRQRVSRTKSWSRRSGTSLQTKLYQVSQNLQVPTNSGDVEEHVIFKREPLSPSRIVSSEDRSTSSRLRQGTRQAANTFSGFSHADLFPDEQRLPEAVSNTAHPSPPKTRSRTPGPSTSAPHSADTRGSVHLPSIAQRHWSSDSSSADSFDPKARKPKPALRKRPSRLKGYLKHLRSVKKIRKPTFGKFKQVYGEPESRAPRDVASSTPQSSWLQEQRELQRDFSRLKTRIAPRADPEITARARPVSWKSLITSAYRSTAIARPLHSPIRKIKKKRPSMLLAHVVPGDGGMNQLELAPAHRNRLQRLARIRARPPGFHSNRRARSPSPAESNGSNAPSPLSPGAESLAEEKRQVLNEPAAGRQGLVTALIRRVAATDDKWSLRMFNKDVKKEAPLHGVSKKITKAKGSSAIMLMKQTSVASETKQEVARKPWQSFRASLDKLRKHRRHKAKARSKLAGLLNKTWAPKVNENVAAKAASSSSAKASSGTGVAGKLSTDPAALSKLFPRENSADLATLSAEPDEQRWGSNDGGAVLAARTVPKDVKWATRHIEKFAKKSEPLRPIKKISKKKGISATTGGMDDSAQRLPTTKQGWPLQPWRSFRASLHRLKHVRKPKDLGRKKLANSLSATWGPKAKANAAAVSAGTSSRKADIKSSPVLVNTFESTATSRKSSRTSSTSSSVESVHQIDRRAPEERGLDLKPRVATSGMKWMTKMFRKDASKEAALHKVADKKISKTRGSSAVTTTSKLPDAQVFPKTKQRWPEKPWQSFRASVDKLRKMREPKNQARKRVGERLHKTWTSKLPAKADGPEGAKWNPGRGSRHVVMDSWGSAAQTHRKTSPLVLSTAQTYGRTTKPEVTWTEPRKKKSKAVSRVEDAEDRTGPR